MAVSVFGSLSSTIARRGFHRAGAMHMGHDSGPKRKRICGVRTTSISPDVGEQPGHLKDIDDLARRHAASGRGSSPSSGKKLHHLR